MIVKNKLFYLLTICALSSFCLTGCLTTELQTSATMSQSIFLNPVAKDKKIVFLNIKNTSGHDVNLEKKLANLLESKGYTLTDDPQMATYILSTNILYCDKQNENHTVGAAAAGGATGIAISGYNNNSTTGIIASGALGALAGGVLGKLTEDTIWQMQVDINIKQIADGKVLTTNQTVQGQADVKNNSRSGFFNTFGGDIKGDKVGKLNSNQVNNTEQVYEGKYIDYNTTILAEAVKTGLTLPEATPILEDKVANQIVGLF